jgi:hypothetical protein
VSLLVVPFVVSVLVLLASRSPFGGQLAAIQIVATPSPAAFMPSLPLVRRVEDQVHIENLTVNSNRRPGRSTPRRATRSEGPGRTVTSAKSSPAPTSAAVPTFWTPVFPGAYWPCTLDPSINVVVDTTGATSGEVNEYLYAINDASTQTGRQVSIVEQAVPASVVPLPNTIYVAWHPIEGVTPTSDLHPAWTKISVTMLSLADGTLATQINYAETVFTAGLPQTAYLHETGREFDLGNSPYPTDDGFGGNFAAARVPANQPFSAGDIAGLQAAAPTC